MKLATINDGSRDGQLIIVNREVNYAYHNKNMPKTLQQVLDNWDFIAEKLVKLYHDLNEGKLMGFPLNTHELMAPLPRAYQWSDGSAYVNHVELVRKARGAEMPENFWTDPLMYQGGSDSFLGPNQAIAVADINWGVDFEAEIAVITNDVPMGCPAETAKDKILFIALVNDVSLRNLVPNEMKKGFGFYQSKPSSAFSPVFVTPDELGDEWDGYKVNLPLRSYLNNQLFGEPNAGVDMTFDFPTLIAHAAKTRSLGAGTIIGSGTVSNTDRSAGSSCIAELRMLEKLEFGDFKTPFMQYGDTVKIEMLNKNNKSIFGAIEQRVVSYENNR
ncbi:MAG: fumarylacetoacetate hydrolase family protein [Pseudomonadota bacterium]